MAAKVWNGAATSVYSTAGNWQGGVAPATADDVTCPDGNGVAITGSDENATALLSFTTKKGYSGTIGTLTAGLPVPLQLKATTYNLGGSGTAYVDLTANSTTTCNVTKAAAGSPATGVYGLSLSSADAIANLNINLDTSGESVGVAALAGQVGTFTTINISGDGTVVLGAGLTCSTLNVQGNGTVYVRTSIANISVVDGSPKVYLYDATAVSGTLLVLTGQVFEESTGTKAQATIFDRASVVCAQGSRIWTNTTVYGAGTLDDEAKSVTFTNPIKDYGSGENIKLGSNKGIQRSAI